MLSRYQRPFALLLLAILSVGGVRVIQINNSQNIALRPLDVDPAHPGPRRVGELIFTGAWELQSDNENFGGISGLTLLPDGRFIGVSDAGTLIGFGLSNNEQTDRPFIAPLPGAAGAEIHYKDRDSEGVTHDPQSGQFWVSYEAHHAIRRFSRSFSRISGEVRPPEMLDWPSNRGAEALIRLRDGRFISIAESVDDGIHQALLFSGDPVEKGSVTSRFTYRPPIGYRVTDGVQLPDGRLAILHRSIGLPDGFAAKVGVLAISDIGKDKTAESRIIATLATPLLVDNLEGIAAQEKDGETYIWLISDNNFFVLQRTILMKFRLAEKADTKKPEAEPAPGFESL
jgi:hypothetical protein